MSLPFSLSLLLLLQLQRNKPHWAGIAALTEQLRAMQVDADVARHLARSMGPKKLANPDTAQHIVEQAEAHAELLGVQRDTVLSLLLRGHSLKIPARELQARLQVLGDVLQLQAAGVCQLVLAEPKLMRVRMSTQQILEQREALQQLLPEWELKQLQSALVQHAAILLRTPALYRQRWDLIQRYCELHRPSAQRFKQVLKDPGGAILRVFVVPTERFRLLEYILERQLEQSRSRSCSSPAGDGAVPEQQPQEKTEKSKGDVVACRAASGTMLNLWRVLKASDEQSEQMVWELPDYREWREWCTSNTRGSSSGRSSGSSETISDS
jgi:hypothetical protein